MFVLKIELPYDPSTSLLGMYLDKTIIQKDTCSTVYNSKDMETTYMSIGRWKDKGKVVHIYNGILLSRNAICTNSR